MHSRADNCMCTDFALYVVTLTSGKCTQWNASRESYAGDDSRATCLSTHSLCSLLVPVGALEAFHLALLVQAWAEVEWKEQQQTTVNDAGTILSDLGALRNRNPYSTTVKPATNNNSRRNCNKQQQWKDQQQTTNSGRNSNKQKTVEGPAKNNNSGRTSKKQQEAQVSCEHSPTLT